MRVTRLSLLVVLVGSVLAVGHAQQPSASTTLDARIDRIFRDRAYQAPKFGPARWLPDGTAYAIVEDAAGGGSEIVKYDAASGAKTVLVAASRLVPQGASAPLDIDDYAWSDDGRRLLIFTNTKKVWRQNTRGDYWVLDLGSGTLTKVDKTAAPSTLMFAKFSPDGSQVGYVRNNNIYVQHLNSGKIDQLTQDGSDAAAASAAAGIIINGTSDWVYEEEFGEAQAWKWSPDSRYIAYWQTNDTPEPEIQVRSQGDGSISHLRNWLDCIRSRKTPNAPMRTGHLAVRAAHIANAALGRESRLRFDEKTGSLTPM